MLPDTGYLQQLWLFSSVMTCLSLLPPMMLLLGQKIGLPCLALHGCLQGDSSMRRPPDNADSTTRSGCGYAVRNDRGQYRFLILWAGSSGRVRLMLTSGLAPVHVHRPVSVCKLRYCDCIANSSHDIGSDFFCMGT